MSREGAPTGLALVTGASRGLGATIARFLAGEGYDLVLTARGRADLEKTADALSRLGGRVFAPAGDVTDPRHRRELAALVARSGPSLHLLVNNASELGPSPLPPLSEYPLRDLEGVYRTNVLAPVGLVQELLGSLVAGRGLVVNISSDAAVGGYPGWGGYGASKAALDLVTLTLAHELAEQGVACVAVDPGDLRTSMHQAAYPSSDISDRPLPEVTVPFWAWLLHQPHEAVSGRRFRAQAEQWEVAP